MNARELAAKVVASVDMDRTSAQYNMQPFNTQMTYYRHIISAIDTATAELRAENQRLRNALCVHCQSGDKPTNGRHTITRPSECEPNEVTDTRSMVTDYIACPDEKARAEMTQPKPCMFCESENVEARKFASIRYVKCWNCGASGPETDTTHKAIDLWNKAVRK